MSNELHVPLSNCSVSDLFTLTEFIVSGLYVVVFLISAHDIFSEMDNLAEGPVKRSYVLTEVCI